VFQNDIIVAQATPPGKGGVGIVRVSGNSLQHIANAILAKLPSPRVAEYLPFLSADKETIDIGLAIYFPSPHSFTGEDVLELHGHGGQVLIDLLVNRVLECGARLANPGEFSFRAFQNDKIDLAQAEAISDLINSTTEAAAKSAMRSLKGEFSRKVQELLEELIYVRVYVESSIDFPEEEIDFLADQVLLNRIDGLLLKMEEVFHQAKQGAVLNEGMSVVILGQPNAGKSSLLNCLAGHDAAIVTDIEGTTRDVLKESIHIDGMPLHIIDTAGLRDNADVVEKEGIRRAWNEVEKADHVLLLVDDSKGFSDKDEKILKNIPPNLSVTIVHNKIDVKGEHSESIFTKDNRTEIYLSIKNRSGIQLLTDHLKQIVGFEGEADGLFIARRRHLNALERAKTAIETGHKQIMENRAGELLSEDLRVAQSALNEITGEFDNEDLLGEIFSSFCIGK